MIIYHTPTKPIHLKEGLKMIKVDVRLAENKAGRKTFAEGLQLKCGTRQRKSKQRKKYKYLSEPE